MKRLALDAPEEAQKTPDLGLSSFRPRPAEAVPPADDLVRALDDVAPRRDPLNEVQLNMRLNRVTARRFRALCRLERRSYADMLERLLDRWDDGAGQGRG